MQGQEPRCVNRAEQALLLFLIIKDLIEIKPALDKVSVDTLLVSSK